MIVFMLNREEESTSPTASQLDNLIWNIANGNEKAFHELYEATRTAVYGFALSIVKNHQDAEDVMQETYISVFRSACSYQGQGKPMAWVLRIARNHGLMKLRDHKKHQALSVDEMANWLEGQRQLSSEDKIVLETAMKVLKEDERQIIVLHSLSGIKHKEIAELLDMKLSTVLSKYHRGLKKMRDTIGEI